MKSTSRLTAIGLLWLFCVFPGASNTAMAQTASSGTVLGTVSDPSAAVVPGADVQLLNTATGQRMQTQTSTSGAYAFANVPPGDYQLTFEQKGFKKTSLHVTVDVAKATLANVSLEIGESAQAVEVTADAAQVALQTTNSTVGNVIEHSEIENLPTAERQITELVYLQPATTPLVGGGEGSAGGGSIAGGRVDQNSATLDGIIITDQAEGGYLASGTISQFSLPVDAIEEFRGAISNPSEDMSNSGGGQFAYTTRQGTNNLHGSLYEYHNNAVLDANSWTRNRLGQARPGLVDNRFGANGGFPIRKDRTFLFLAYEGRRFPQSQDAERTGITATLRQGILRFPDATGTVQSYNFNPANGALASRCGPGGNLPCDPRGIGISPIISKYFSFYPTGNDPSTGDGFNSIGIRGPVSTPLISDFALGRLDHAINSKWHVFTEYMYQRSLAGDTVQVDFNPAVTNGRLLKSLSGSPQWPQMVGVGLTGQLTPHLVNDLRLGYVKEGFTFARQLPENLIPTAGPGALLLASVAPVTLDNAGDPLAVRARPEGSVDKFHQYNDSLTWIKGNHFIATGFMYQHIRMYHHRVDKIPATEVPEAQIGSGQFVTIPSADRPPTCSATLQTDCLTSGEIGSWNQLYASLLGIWDNTQTFNVRDANGNPVSGFQPLTYVQTAEHYQMTGSDTWQLRPSTTLNYGLNVQYETPFHEINGLDYLLVDANTLKPIDPHQLLQQKLKAAEQGQVFNEQFAYVHPAQIGGRGLYPAVFNFNPRASLAWNPSLRNGVFGKVFGDRKTVLRGGYALVHDQVLGIQTELWGVIGNQLLASANQVVAPTCNAAGTPGSGCTPGAPFRVGVDGATFVPPPGPFAIPDVPPSRNVLAAGSTFGVASGDGFDPDFHVGRIHGLNFTVQRELPGDSLLEAGWIGRYGRNLASAVNVNTPPVVSLKDLSGKSNQTFAQAFDQVATQLRSGTSPAQVTAQPWFDNELGTGATVTIASAASSAFTQDAFGSLITNTVDPMLQAAGLPTTENQQFSTLNYQTDGGWMNYEAFFMSFRKRTSHGLTLTFNYTLAHCLDTNGQQSDNMGGALADPYNPRISYGDCVNDIRHNVQTYGTYYLPVATKASGFASKALKGWYTSYIVTASTGLPVTVGTGDPYGSNTGSGLSAAASGPVSKTGFFSGVPGSNGIGTTGNPATGGTGLNLFANPAAVFENLRPILSSEDHGSNRGMFHGLGQWNLDLSIGKDTRVTERVTIKFSADFLNAFNHPNFLTPGNIGTNSLSLFAPQSFGVITNDQSATFGNIGVGPRRIQGGLRLEF
jgi:hypothetical protein